MEISECDDRRLPSVLGEVPVYISSAPAARNTSTNLAPW